MPERGKQIFAGWFLNTQLHDPTTEFHMLKYLALAAASIINAGANIRDEKDIKQMADLFPLNCYGMYKNTYITKYNFIFSEEDDTVNIDQEYIDGI